MKGNRREDKAVKPRRAVLTSHQPPARGEPDPSGLESAAQTKAKDNGRKHLKVQILALVCLGTTAPM